MWDRSEALEHVCGFKENGEDRKENFKELFPCCY